MLPMVELSWFVEGQDFGMSLELSPHHLDALAARWITPAIAQSAGLFSVNTREGGLLIRRNGSEGYSGIAIPYYRPDGSVYEHRIRRDYPELEEKEDGETREVKKYLSRFGAHVEIYQPRGTHELHSELPFIIVEGEFKTLALLRLCTHGTDKPRWRPIGIQGSWCWRGTVKVIPTADGEQRVKGPIIQPKAGDTIILVPDSNFHTNRHVSLAWRQLGRYCEKKGAKVSIAFIPEEDGVNGIDDYLARHGADAGLELIANAKPLEANVIYIRGGSFDENVRSAEEYLAEATAVHAETGIYQRNGLLVHIARLDKATDSNGIKRPEGSLQILTTTPHFLRMRLSACAKWLRFRSREKDWMPTDPPSDIAPTLIDIVGEWPHTPYLAGIVQAPGLRPDGTIFATPGWDPPSGLYFDPAGTSFPVIPANPSKEDAKAALSTLRSTISGFPYVDESSRSVMLAAMMTPLCRHAMRSAPLFAFTAPAARSGKTLEARLPSYMSTGLVPRLFSLPNSLEEAKKRYLAMLQEGGPVTVIDNIERPLKDDALCSILTEPAWSERILGTNRTLSVSTATTWIATGNSLRVEGDLSSRTLLCSIDAGVERPEERKFDVDLDKDVPKRRGEFVAAALTIVRAYMISGERVEKVTPFGGFEDWSRIVREPLIWLGCADPCATRERVRAGDTERENLSALLTAFG